MFRRRVPFPQKALAMLLGVAGGLYIYRPFFEPMLKKSSKQNPGETKKEKETD
ncbi:protein PIGBOS1 [Platichthys flesus]|uniref:protein PIGBOS1 n=1 Tax=Platichthys flesus TaxID=8260 RepID=UPI002DB8BB41|nr:protein PIGBOS1 [Platichthys flesus]